MLETSSRCQLPLLPGTVNAKPKIQILSDSTLGFLLDNRGGEIFLGFFNSGVYQLGYFSLMGLDHSIKKS